MNFGCEQLKFLISHRMGGRQVLPEGLKITHLGKRDHRINHMYNTDKHTTISNIKIVEKSGAMPMYRHWISAHLYIKN